MRDRETEREREREREKTTHKHINLIKANSIRQIVQRQILNQTNGAKQTCRLMYET